MKAYEFSVTGWAGFRNSVIVVASSWEEAFGLASEEGRYPFCNKIHQKVVLPPKNRTEGD